MVLAPSLFPALFLICSYFHTPPSVTVKLVLVYFTITVESPVRFLLSIVACDFCSARSSRHGKIVYDFYDIKLPVATIVVGF